MPSYSIAINICLGTASDLLYSVLDPIGSKVNARKKKLWALLSYRNFTFYLENVTRNELIN